LNKEDAIEAILLDEEMERRIRYSARDFFVPSLRQLEFFYSTARFTQFSGSNQTSGKTSATKIKISYHLDGKYPRDKDGNLVWRGVMFDKPVTWAVGGVTAVSTRDNLVDGFQTKPGLLGPPDARGTGAIPLSSLDVNKVVLKTGGAKNQVDHFFVKWHRWDEKKKRYTWDGVSYSLCLVFEYSSDWQRFQGYTLDGISLDEEAPMDFFSELMARLISTSGYLDLTMTPLHGYSDVVEMFERKSEESPEKWRVIYASIHDAHWMSEERKQEEIKNWTGTYLELPRLYGRPNAGEGMIYKTPHDFLVIDPINIPDDWPRIVGIDIPHTTGHFAATWWAFDRATDTLICYDEFKAKLGTDGRAVYKEALMARGCHDIPIAWPHDAARGSGFGNPGTWVDWLRDSGLNVLGEASYMMTADGKKSHASIIAIIDECSHRMQTGRIKIQSNCQGLLKEMMRYGSENGIPKKKQDDHLIDSMHKAVMMRDYAEKMGDDQYTYAKPGFGGEYNFFGAN